MKYSFSCYGHENITAAHKNTLEFTKDDFVTKKGDCIVGCKADFRLVDLKKFIENSKERNESRNKNNSKEKNDRIKVKITITIGDLIEEIAGVLNSDFDHASEIVIRKSDFISDRTFLITADKAANEFSDHFKGLLSKKGTKIVVFFDSF